MVFLKVLLALLLVGVVLIVLGAWWLRRKVRGAIATATRYARVLPPIPMADRLTAVSDSNRPEPESGSASAAATLWRGVLDAGFVPLGEFTSPRLAILQAARHPHSGVVAAVLVPFGQEPFSEFYLLDESRVAHVLSTDPLAQDLDLPHLKVFAVPANAAFDAIARWAPLRSAQPALDANTLPLFYQRAHSLRRDESLARKPDLAWLRELAARRGLANALGETEWPEALDSYLGSWNVALELALRDHARRALGLGERHEDEETDDPAESLLILHRELDSEALIGLFNDEKIIRLGQQLEQQQLSPRQIFEGINQRLDVSARYILRAQIQKPIPAQVYEPPAATAVHGLNEYLYEAVGESGDVQRGALVASSIADARFQLTRMGRRQVRILSGDMAPLDLSQHEAGMRDELAGVAVRAQSESLPQALLTIARGNWMLWLPPSLLVAWNLYQGAPFGWGDYISFALLLLSLGFLLLVMTPTALYNAILSARIFGRYRRGLIYVWLLQRLNVFGFLPASITLGERCKFLAAMGRRQDAEAALHELETRANGPELAGVRIAVAEAFHDYPEVIRIMEAQARAEPDKPEFAVDFALALARYSTRQDEAEQILAGAHPGSLSELAVGALHFARGVLAQAQGKHANALRELRQADRVFAGFSLPLCHAMACEIRGYLAVSLKAQGEVESAAQVWAQAWPVLQHGDREYWRQRYG